MIMKQTLLALLLAGALQGAVAAPATPVKEVDRIVAVVNKNVITWLDLQARVDEAIKQLQAQKWRLRRARCWKNRCWSR